MSLPLVAPRNLVTDERALRDGTVDARDYLAAVGDRIEQVDREVGSFVAVPDRRRRLEDAADDVRARWPDPSTAPSLFAIPVGVKDIVHVDGWPTRAGSDVPPETLSGPEASVVSRLRAAGAVVAGKTVTAEFAHFAPGRTRNPHALGHTPGGSSSGSAAAVAAGLVPLAIGTQTMGSVIRPAAFCGVVGFKPTFGRIPTDGVIPFAPSLDTVGLFAADVKSAALAAAVVCDSWRDVPALDRHPVLGVPVGPYLERASETAAAIFAGHVGRLRAAGFAVRDVPALADIDEVVTRCVTISRYELARSHAPWFDEYGERYRPETVAAIRQGRAIPSLEYDAARRASITYREALVQLMVDARIDGWIAPPAPGPAPEGLETTGDPIMCLPWTVAGFPAVTVPAGTTAGLPLGLQCVGRPGADEHLLGWAPAVASAVLR